MITKRVTLVCLGLVRFEEKDMDIIIKGDIMINSLKKIVFRALEQW